MTLAASTIPEPWRGMLDAAYAEINNLRARGAESENARVEEWNKRRAIAASRDIDKATIESMRIEIDALRKSGWPGPDHRRPQGAIRAEIERQKKLVKSLPHAKDSMEKLCAIMIIQALSWAIGDTHATEIRIKL